jgi:hypothetical protein
MNQMTATHAFPSTSRPRMPWLLLGGLAVASLDLAFASAYWMQFGASPTRVLQSIAAWMLGPPAFDGGLRTALLGALSYGLLMWGVVAGYHAASRRWALLRERPVLCGAVYGAMTYVLVLEIAVPLLSAAGPTPRQLDWTLACVVAYVLLVGIPAAQFSRLARHPHH